MIVMHIRNAVGGAIVKSPQYLQYFAVVYLTTNSSLRNLDGPSFRSAANCTWRIHHEIEEQL